MFASLFNSEAPFWRMMSSLVDVLALSLMWLFTSLPIITLGAATAALYDASVKYVRPRHHGAWLQFFRVFRRELPGSILPSLIWAVGIVLFSIGLNLTCCAVLNHAAGAPLFLAAYCVVMLIPAGALCWSFPLLSRFTLSPLGVIRTGLQFSIAYLPFTLLIVLSLVLAVLASAILLLPMLVLPCLVALLWSLMMERAFRKFMPPSPPDSEGPPAP